MYELRWLRRSTPVTDRIDMTEKVLQYRTKGHLQESLVLMEEGATRQLWTDWKDVPEVDEK